MYHPPPLTTLPSSPYQFKAVPGLQSRVYKVDTMGLRGMKIISYPAFGEYYLTLLQREGLVRKSGYIEKRGLHLEIQTKYFM